MGVEADVRGAAVRVAGLGVCCFPRGSQGAGPIQKPTSPEWPMRPRPKRPCGRNLVSGLGLANRRPTRPDVRGVWLYASPPADARCDGRGLVPAQEAGGTAARAGDRGEARDRRRGVASFCRGDTRGQPHSRAPRTSTSTPNSNPTCRWSPPGRCPALATPGSACVPPSRPGEPRLGRRAPAPAPISSFTPHTPPAVACTCVRCAWRLRRRRRGGLGRGSGDAQGVRERAGACGWAGGRACARARAVWCWARGNAPSEPLDLSPGALRLRAAAPSPRARQAPYNPPHTWHLACRSPGGGWPCPRAPVLQGRCI